MIPPTLVLVIPLIGLGFVTYRRGKMDESDLARMEKEHWRDEFGEWISEGKMPDKVPNVSLEMDSLEDLVDAAVDMDNRVIYDEEKSTHFIIQEGVLYKYTHKKRTNSKKKAENELNELLNELEKADKESLPEKFEKATQRSIDKFESGNFEESLEITSRLKRDLEA